MTALGMVASATLMGQQLVNANDIGGFGTLKLSGRMNVELIKAEQTAIEVELFDSETKNLNWSIANNTLSMSLRPSRNAHANVKIYYRELTDINASDVELISRDTIRANMFDLSVGSGAKVTLTVQCADAEVAVRGNSALSLSGETDHLTLLATENSKVDTRGLRALSVTIETATVAEVYVTAIERLSARAKTGSTIFFKGEPSILRTRTGSIGASINNIGK